MTRSTKITLILILLFLLITFLREIGYIGLYSYTIITTDRTGNAVSHCMNTATISKHDLNHILCPADSALKGKPLLIYCQGSKYGEQGSIDRPPAMVVIDHIEHGSLQMPLYKSTHFHALVPVDHSFITYGRDNRDSVKFHIHQFKGTITVDGEITITGFCTGRKAESLLADKVMACVYKAMRSTLDAAR